MVQLFMEKCYHQRLIEMLDEYERKHGRKPAIIALGKTHLEDLQNYFEPKPDGLYFEGIEVMQHNDPIGILFAHDKR